MKRVSKSYDEATERLIFEVLSSKLQMENELDSVKTELLSHTKFNATDLFQMLDTHKQRRITHNEIQLFFKKEGLLVSPSEVEAILGYFTDSESIDFNTFFLRLLPHSGRHVPPSDSSMQELTSKIFLTMIECSQNLNRNKQNLGILESVHIERCCKDGQSFTVYDLEALFNRFGGEPITGQNVKAVFGSKLRMTRNQLCGLLGVQLRESTLSSSTCRKEPSEATTDCDRPLKPGKYVFKRMMSCSFFEEKEVKFFTDMTVPEYEMEMHFE